MTLKKTIVITGSSSGFGFALAKKYATPNVSLFLFGKSITRLNQIEEICLQKGAVVKIFSIDVQEMLAMKNQIEENL